MSKTLTAIKANFDARQKLVEEIRGIDEAAEGRAYDADETVKATELRSTLDAIDARLQENLRQEIRSAEITDAAGTMLGLLEDKNTGDLVDQRSLGERFSEDDEVRSWVAAGARGQSGVFDQKLDFRAVTDTTTGGASGGAFINPQRLDRVGYTFLDRKVYLLDVLPRIVVSTGSVEYVQDTSPTADLANKAAETAEGAVKPQAGVTLSVITEPVATIAAWMNITRQVAADSPQLMGYLDNRLRYSLKRRADAAFISGSGVAPALNGLTNRAGIITYAPIAAEARYRSIRRGVRLMEDAETVPEIIVLNPADAELFDLSNDATQGLHAVPNVAGASARTSWGLTQVRSTAIAAGTALLIDPMALAVLDREQVSAYMTDSHASLFISNILTLLLEMRCGLALFEPNGVAKITFNGTV